MGAIRMAHRDLRVIHEDPSNAQALKAWDGEVGAYWVENEPMFDDLVARYDHVLFERADIAPGDRILDIGCGNGKTTRTAARLAAPGGRALGVDLSSRMVERARQRAREEGTANARFIQADAQVYPFGAAAFDMAISRAGVMFFGDAIAAFTNIGRALRRGAWLVVLTWQPLSANEWMLEFSRALAPGRTRPEPAWDEPGPFSLADPNRVQAILTAAGFDAITLEGVTQFLHLGADCDRAYRFVRDLPDCKSMLRGLSARDRKRGCAVLRESVEAHQTADGILYPSAAWIVRATRN